MASISIKSTYSLDPDTVRTLDEIARRWKVSKSEVLRRAIRAVADRAPEQSHDALQALDDLQKSLGTTAATTRAWIQAARAERRASSRRREARAE
jgi:predicted transcriptional regulator